MVRALCSVSRIPLGLGSSSAALLPRCVPLLPHRRTSLLPHSTQCGLSIAACAAGRGKASREGGDGERQARQPEKHTTTTAAACDKPSPRTNAGGFLDSLEQVLATLALSGSILGACAGVVLWVSELRTGTLVPKPSRSCACPALASWSRLRVVCKKS